MNFEAVLKRNKNVITISIFSLITVLLIWSRFSFLALPMDRDEGAYAYTAWRMSEGELPYRDVFDHKPPGIFLIYKAAIAVTDGSTVGIRLFTSIWAALTLAAVFAAGWSLFGRSGGLAAAFFFALFQSSVMLEAVNSNAEIFMCLPIAIAVFAFSLRKKHIIFSGLAGLFLGAAVMIKSSAVFVPAAFIIVLYGLKAPKKELVFFLAGCFMIPVFLTASAAVLGIFEDFVRDFALYNASYVFEHIKNDAGSGPLANLAAFSAEQWAALCGAGLMSFMIMKKKAGFEAKTALYAFAAGAAGILLLKGMYAHYYTGLLPFAALCAAFLVKEIRKLKFGFAACALVIAASFVSVFAANSKFYSMDPAEVSFAQFRTHAFSDSETAAKFIKKYKKNSSSLLVLSAHPQIYYQAGIKVHGRYSYILRNTLVRDIKGVGEFIQSNIDNPPDFLVLDDTEMAKRTHEVVGSLYDEALKMRALSAYVKRAE